MGPLGRSGRAAPTFAMAMPGRRRWLGPLLLGLLVGAWASGGAGDGSAVSSPYHDQHRALLSPFSPDARPPLNYTKGFTAFEFCTFSFAVVVLSLSLVMFVRLYDALSPPTKIIVSVVAANLVVAVVFLIFTCEKIYFLVRGEGYVPVDEHLCRYLHPPARAAIVYMWCGQALCAWVTLKTIRNEYVPPATLRRWVWACALAALYFLVMAEVFGQGVVVWGSFCGVPPIYSDRTDGGLGYRNGRSVPAPILDPRVFHMFVGFGTLLLSIVFYARAYRHLSAFNKRWRRDLEERRRRHLEAERIKNSHLQPPPPQAAHPWSGSSGPGSVLSRSSDPSALEAGQSQGRGGRHCPWRRLIPTSAAAAGGNDDEKDGTEPPAGGRSRASTLESVDGQDGGGGEVDGDDGSVYSDMSRDSDDPVSLAEIQARTRAAQRAAVLMLLPTAAATGQQQQGQEGGAAIADGVDIESGGGGGGSVVGSDVSVGRPPVGSYPQSVSGSEGGYAADTEGASRRVRRPLVVPAEGKEETDPAEVAELLHKASRTLFRRAVIMMGAYYLPYIMIMLALIKYKGGPPPIEILSVVMGAYALGTPLLQALILVHVAVSIGANILKFRDAAEAEAAMQRLEQHQGQGAGGGNKFGNAQVPRAAGRSQHDAEGGAFPFPPGGAFPFPTDGYAYERGAASVASSTASSRAPPAATATQMQGGQQPPPQEQQEEGHFPSPPPRDHLSRAVLHPYPKPSRRRRRLTHGAPNPGGASGRGRMQALATIYEVAFRNRGRDAAAAAIAAAAADRGKDKDKGTAPVALSSVAGGGSSAEDEDGDGKSTRSLETRRTMTVGTSLVQETLGINLAKSSSSSGGSGGDSGGGDVSSNSAFGGSDSSSAFASSGAPSVVSSSHGGGGAAALLPLPRAIRSFLIPADRASSVGRASEVSSLTDNSYQDGVLGALARRRRPRVWSARSSDAGVDATIVERAEREETPSPLSSPSAARVGAPQPPKGPAVEEKAVALAVAIPSEGDGSGGDGGGGGAGAGSGSSRAPPREGLSRASSVCSSIDTDDGGRSIVTESDFRAWQQEGGSVG